NTIRKIILTSDGAAMVSTFAGLAGESGYADGTGSEARFTVPAGVAVDSAGNIYVADSKNQTIRKITPQAVVSTWAGAALLKGRANGIGKDARFSGPAALAADRADNIYVA